MTTEEKIRVMQAYEEGKQIQYKRNNENVWHYCFNPIWDWSLNIYRVKPEEKNQTYRPYKDTEEMIADFKERFKVDVSPYAMPLIWLSNKDVPEYSLVTDYSFEDGVCTSDMGWDLKELLERFTYIDGSQVGKLVEE